MTVSIGTLQFGYSIGSWNTAFKPYEIKQDQNGGGWVKVTGDWTDPDFNAKDDIDKSKANNE